MAAVSTEAMTDEATGWNALSWKRSERTGRHAFASDRGAPMATRRSFMARAGAAGAGLAVASFRAGALTRGAPAGGDAGASPACELARDEDYWSEIQRSFDTDRTVVNFNNGGVCPTPTHVLDQMIRDLRFSNESPVQHMWRVLEPRVESVRRDLAHEFGCDAEEIAITRNASEAMET